MDEFPMVDRVKFSFAARLTSLGLALLCLVGPFVYFGAFQISLLQIIKDTLEFSPTIFISLINGYGPSPSDYSVLNPKRALAVVAIFSFGVTLLWQALFKVDVTYTITSEIIMRVQRFFVGSASRSWQMSDVASVCIITRGRAVEPKSSGETDPSPKGEKRFRLEIIMRSGARVRLPLKRHYATVLRMKQAIDEIVSK